LLQVWVSPYRFWQLRETVKINHTSRCSSHASRAGQFLSRGFVVLLRKSIPQNHNLKTAAELGYMDSPKCQAQAAFDIQK
jgi:hypothetical protein